VGEPAVPLQLAKLPDSKPSAKMSGVLAKPTHTDMETNIERSSNATQVRRTSFLDELNFKPNPIGVTLICLHHSLPDIDLAAFAPKMLPLTVLLLIEAFLMTPHFSLKVLKAF
jgi:hypothetical protein